MGDLGPANWTLAAGQPGACSAGRKWIDWLLDAAGDNVEPRLLALALRVRGATYDMTWRGDLAAPEYEHAAEISTSLGDEPETAHLMHRIAFTALHKGDVERAVRLASDALELDRRHGRRRDEAMALNILSQAAFEQGDPEEGLRLGYESADLAKAVDFTWWHGVTLVQATEYLIAAGDAAAAAEPLLAGLTSLAAVDDRVNLPIALAASAALAAQHENASQAGDCSGAPSKRPPRPSRDRLQPRHSPTTSRTSTPSAVPHSTRPDNGAAHSQSRTRSTTRSRTSSRDRRRPSVGIRIRSRKPDLRGLLDRTQRCHDYLRSALSDLNICEKARAIRGTVRPPRSPSVPHDE